MCIRCVLISAGTKKKDLAIPFKPFFLAQSASGANVEVGRVQNAVMLNLAAKTTSRMPGCR